MKKVYPIYWSPEAEETYLKILTYILTKWSVIEAENYEKKVEGLLTRLSHHKYLCFSKA